MPSVKPFLVISCCAFGLAACNANTASGDRPDPPATDFPAPATETAPAIGTFTFDDIDIAGCGLSLWAPGSDPRADGVYLFSGMQPPSGSAEIPMRMKVNGTLVQFQRTGGEGEEYYGQFDRQTFTSLGGDLTAEVNSEVTSRPENAEVLGVNGTITVIGPDGQTTSVEAIGDAGC
ncbi:hypothetical protein [Nodosilinea sp. E11]|uniref:hypothetical protein n=1 Tax=Nodosilinea sp. E11 TaxID=3037479 RepID=UPI002934D264|nr:hypothetical protein [Nodosilinea sp. E11]WOD41502.1 hypothetical protein RRF56_11925 [Nodosilinea sp. E11]